MNGIAKNAWRYCLACPGQVHSLVHAMRHCRHHGISYITLFIILEPCKCTGAFLSYRQHSVCVCVCVCVGGGGGCVCVCEG